MAEPFTKAEFTEWRTTHDRDTDARAALEQQVFSTNELMQQYQIVRDVLESCYPTIQSQIDAAMGRPVDANYVGEIIRIGHEVKMGPPLGGKTAPTAARVT